MIKNKTWAIINVSLGLIAIILFLSLMGFQFPTFGQALYNLDVTDSLCVVGYDNHYSFLPDIDRCCVGLQQQLIAETNTQTISVGEEKVVVNKHYYTSKDTINYFINMKTYRYCKNSNYI